MAQFNFTKTKNNTEEMQTSSFFKPLTPVGGPFSGAPLQPKRADHNRLTTMAFKKDGSSGKIVDENMIVLRERIRKMACGGGGDDDDRLPDNWMQWEKTYASSGSYHSDIYEAVAFLQRFLMESRPSVALGLVAVFALGGSTAVLTVLQLLINLVHGN